MQTQYRGFELRPNERRLLVRGEAVQVGARAFDVLVTLAERADRVVGKHELLDLVWPGLVVEENNLQVHIHALRKILGASVIATVPGRGYKFTAEADVHAKEKGVARADGEASPGTTARTPGNVPQHLPPLYGREEALASVVEMVRANRMVTITGPGGIGKTRLAQAAVHQMRSQFTAGVWLVELAPVQNGQHVAATIAQTLGIQPQARSLPATELAAALHEGSVLLVLDNCEHLVDCVAEVACNLLAATQAVHIVATSQEVLRIRDEHVYRVQPLSVPPAGDVTDAASYGSVRLFVERAQAQERAFALDARNAVAVADVCRRLDGIPLAIELAAARVPSLGVFALHDRLDERFRMLTGGARLSFGRHQTLRAALDWSHQLLGPEEQTVFRRLAVFVDGFSVEAAQLVCSDAAIDEWQVLDVLNTLIDKSLVQVDAGQRPRYRLLESTRAYAMGKLSDAGETQDWLVRHSSAMLTVCQLATRQRDVDWMWAEMSNIREAYQFSLSPAGDRRTAISLATSSAMVLAVYGFIDEALERLLQVEPWVDDAVPLELAARFWQFLGRSGIDGRLSSSRCIAAFTRAKGMFSELGNGRHVHACLRMRAEALVLARDLDAAAADLADAEGMEVGDWPVSDRLRRLRIEGVLASARGRWPEALARFQHALDLAKAAGIERYVFNLLLDIARVRLESGDAAEAAAQFRRLAEKAAAHPAQGRIRGHAMIGLVAALTGQEEVAHACAAAQEGLGHVRRCGLLPGYCDVYGWLACKLGEHATAARLAGAADAFFAKSETSRDPTRAHAQEDVKRALAGVRARLDLRALAAEGAHLDEGMLAGIIRDLIERHAADREAP